MPVANHCRHYEGFGRGSRRIFERRQSSRVTESTHRAQNAAGCATRLSDAVGEVESR
jgi:hypothetical protein